MWIPAIATDWPVDPLRGKTRARGLRIRPDYTAGTCVECRQTLDSTTICLLADHIRAENHEDEESASEEGNVDRTTRERGDPWT